MSALPPEARLTLRPVPALGGRGAAALALMLLLAGCATPPEVDHPDLEPDLTLPSAWTAEPGSETREDEAREDEPGRAGDIGWWREFGDERLDRLLLEAADQNVDLRVAAARVEQAAAQATIAGADGLPQVGLQFDGARARQNFVGLPIPGSSGVVTNRYDSFGVSLDVSWELDIWGRIRSGQSAAMADREAAIVDLNGAYISLMAQVAKAWFAAVESRRQVELGEATVATFESTFEQVRSRYEEGLRSPLDVRLSRTDLANARASLASTRQQYDAAMRQLEILVGRYPAAAVEVGTGLPTLRARAPAYLPAEIVSRRPDLTALERRLAAAGARVDQARAALYPRISLTASGGTSSNELGDLIDGDFSVWRLAGNALQPIFQGGRLLAGLDLAKAASREALAQYVSGALRAFGEVETALAAEEHLSRTEEALTVARDEAEAAWQLARARYVNGLDDIITLLTAQRLAAQAESRLLTVRRQRLDARVDLHLALGGGFEWPGRELTEPRTPSS